MRLLLDTHALLWALASPQKLSSDSVLAIEDASNELWVSSVSFFEIATKARSGKLAVPADLLTNWEWTMARLGARILALQPDSAIVAGQLDWAHRDPFDRMLAAQALVGDLILVTADSGLQACPNLHFLW